MRLQRSPNPIGIDLGGRYLSAVQLSASKPHPKVRAATTIKRMGQTCVDPADLARLADVLERHGFVGREAVVSVPAEFLMTAILELPPRSSGAPLDKISRAELATAHGCTPDEIESAFWELPEPLRRREGTPYMVVGCRHTDANAILDAFDQAGLEVVALDTYAAAASRACKPRIDQMNGLDAIVLLGWSAAQLVVLVDGIVVYDRPLLESGLDRLHDSLQNDLGLDPDVIEYFFRDIGIGEDGGAEVQQEVLLCARERLLEYVSGLVPEIRRSLGYAAQEYGRSEVTHLLVLGESSLIPGVVEHLCEAFELTPEVVTPAGLTPDPGPAEKSAALVTAFGLAQHGGRAA